MHIIWLDGSSPASLFLRSHELHQQLLQCSSSPRSLHPFCDTSWARDSCGRLVLLLLPLETPWMRQSSRSTCGARRCVGKHCSRRDGELHGPYTQRSRVEAIFRAPPMELLLDAMFERAPSRSRSQSCLEPSQTGSEYSLAVAGQPAGCRFGSSCKNSPARFYEQKS